MKIAIYGSRRQYGVFDIVARFLAMLSRRGVEVVMHRKLYTHLLEAVPEALVGVTSVGDTLETSADLVVSLGGDGTFLRTAMWVGEREIPIIGVNTGHLGYLTALTVDELPDMLDLIATDRIRIERRNLLEVMAPALPSHFAPYALNEVAVLKEDTASMIHAAVSIDGTPMADYRADGLLVCTSTGSTAYNLSVGGPIVQPTVDVFVVSPVAAHSLSMRPLVIDGRCSLSIVPTGRAERVRVALDGRSVELRTGTEIRLRKAPFQVLVMQMAEHTFSDVLRDKLHWGDQ